MPASTWWLVPLAVASVAILMLLCFCCCQSAVPAAAVPVACDEEPEKKYSEEWWRWKRECDERKKRNASQTKDAWLTTLPVAQKTIVVRKSSERESLLSH